MILEFKETNVTVLKFKNNKIKPNLRTVHRFLILSFFVLNTGLEVYTGIQKPGLEGILFYTGRQVTHGESSV